MTVLLDGPRYCGVTMSRYSQVARPESMRYHYWAHVSELPDMWPVVLKRRRCLIYSSYFRVRWISTDNPLETAIIFYVKSVPGKISMLSPLAKWTMAVRISQVSGIKRSVKTLWIWHLYIIKSPDLGTRSLAMCKSALTRGHITRHVTL